MKTLCFDIGGTSIKYGECSDGTLLNAAETPTNAHLGGSHVVETLTDLISRFQGYEAIGISTAGQVDSQRGVIIYANENIPGYTGMELRGIIGERFCVPVMVENDVNCAAMGEAIYGAGRDYDSFLCLTYGTGIGGAIIENSRIYHGSSYSAGEFGGIVTHGSARNAERDMFSGCYEQYASASALVRSAKSLDPSLSNGRTVFSRLEEPRVKRVVDDWIEEILLGLVTVIHMFNPPCVILGGGIMVQPYIINSLRERLYSRIMPSFSHVVLETARLGNHAGLLGASYLTELYSKHS